MSSRKEKAFIQNIYLLQMDKVKNKYVREFKVVGTTNNVYTVTIDNDPRCTCPDCAYRGKICKHIYFIMLRIMQINGDVKNHYNNNELLEMFYYIPAYVSNDMALKQEKKKDIKQKFDDKCPICLDNITEKSKNLDYCKYGCGKSVHQTCLTIWQKSNKVSLKCFFCRHDWDVGMKHDDLDDSDLDDFDLENLGDDSEDDEFNEDESDLDEFEEDIIQDDLSKYSLNELIELATNLGLSKSGTKQVLINRIQPRLRELEN